MYKCKNTILSAHHATLAVQNMRVVTLTVA